VMDVTLTQHPVGQGGMMSGLLNIPGGQFHWVYDCGSNQSEALNREIALVAARGDVDCLFLSHLDSDHVNGVDRLLMATGVKEVVLPYLNDLDRLIAAAHDHATGALSGGFLTFLSDMEGWFGARGVERVTFIMPRDDDDEGEDGRGPELPRSDGGGEGPIRAKWSHPAQDYSAPAGDSLSRSKGPMVQRFETTASLHLSAASGMLDWLLLPYAHRPSEAQLLAFRKAMHRKFGPKYPARLKALLSDPALREMVRECYDLIWSDHNLVSMALYAGPRESQHWQGDCLSKPLWWHHYQQSNAVGWFETGDMHLNVGRRRKAFVHHYRDVLDQVNVFALPHHGSHRNFHDSLFGELPNMSQCVAATGPNGYGHPSDSVKQSVHSSGKEFVHVSHKGKSVLQWRHSR
jgi:Metallo-beta-lactamase superfamily